ncbi:MAG: hypothetical protein IJU44_13190 [Kiritimatiellae bacterium]|nr:hypothetical protein [Kiritimatiellia bacterium]
MLKHMIYIVVIVVLSAVLIITKCRMFLLQQEMSANVILCTNAYSALNNNLYDDAKRYLRFGGWVFARYAFNYVPPEDVSSLPGSVIYALDGGLFDGILSEKHLSQVEEYANKIAEEQSTPNEFKLFIYNTYEKLSHAFNDTYDDTYGCYERLYLRFSNDRLLHPSKPKLVMHTTDSPCWMDKLVETPGRELSPEMLQALDDYCATATNCNERSKTHTSVCFATTNTFSNGYGIIIGVKMKNGEADGIFKVKYRHTKIMDKVKPEFSKYEDLRRSAIPEVEERFRKQLKKEIGGA